MKKSLFFCVVVLGFGFVSCRRDSPARKIIEGAPVGSAITALPVSAVQGFQQFERDFVSLLVAVTRRTGVTGSTFNDVSSLGGGNYQFVVSREHYGQATVVFNFNNGAIDPIQMPSSTSTINTVNISATSSGSPFNGSGTFALTLGTLGNLNSPMRLTGSYTFTGTGITVTCTLPAPGSLSTFDGLSSGALDITGTDPDGAVTGALTIDTSHEFNGSLNWAGHNSQIHVKDNGDALLLLDNERHFFD